MPELPGLNVIPQFRLETPAAIPAAAMRPAA
jgi:hypothetical protein